MQHLISVIIPVYNCEKYIVRIINSILNQSYSNFELIVVNDGSTDNTLNVLNSFKDPRINIISKKNSGVSDSRNIGFAASTGDLICFLDADDYIDQDYFKEVIDIFKKYPNLDLLNFGFYSDTENMKMEQTSSDKISYKDIYYSSKEEIKNDFVNLWDNTMLYNIWNKVYHRKIIEKNNIVFPPYNWGEDVAFNRLYLNNLENLYNSSKTFYHYIRERKGAYTNIYKKDLFDIRKKEFTEFNEYFDTWEIPKVEYYEFSCRRYIERILGCIENIFSSNLKFKEKYMEVKNIIKNSITRETLKYAKPKSKKIKIMIIPINLKMTLLTMFMGKIFHFVKTKCPSLFNKLKNRR